MNIGKTIGYLYQNYRLFLLISLILTIVCAAVYPILLTVVMLFVFYMTTYMFFSRDLQLGLSGTPFEGERPVLHFYGYCFGIQLVLMAAGCGIFALSRALEAPQVDPGILLNPLPLAVVLFCSFCLFFAIAVPLLYKLGTAKMAIPIFFIYFISYGLVAMASSAIAGISGAPAWAADLVITIFCAAVAVLSYLPSARIYRTSLQHLAVQNVKPPKEKKAK